MDVVVQMPSGVRMRFATTSTTIEVEVMLTHLRQLPHDLRPAIFDLVVDGELISHREAIVGHLFTLVGGSDDDITFEAGDPTRIFSMG